MKQGCTIAIEFAKITEHFLNLLNSIVIEPRLVSKCKKSEGRYCYWYCTSSCMIIEFNCVIEILSLCILLLKLRLKCHFSSSTIATGIEKLLCIELQLPLKSKITLFITMTVTDIEHLIEHLLKLIWDWNSVANYWACNCYWIWYSPLL